MPFTEEQFLGVFSSYNEALWPVAALLWVLTAMALGLLAGRLAHGRLIGALLAIHWLWAGAVYHLVFFSTINPAARVFGAAFILEGLLFLWYGAVKGRLDFRWGRSPRQALSIVLALFSLAYPALVRLSGFEWPAMPAYGVPCPTAILTMGLLLALPPANHRGLAVIPVLWALVASSAAAMFRVLPDFMLPIAAVVLVAWCAAPRMTIWSGRRLTAA